VHLTPAERAVGFRGCAEAVAPGGTLLIVGHHPSDLEGRANRWPDLDRFFTPEDLATDLGPDWEVVATDTRPRTATDPDGNEMPIHDSVLVARRLMRPAA